MEKNSHLTWKSRKMNTFPLVLISILSQLLFMYNAVENTSDTTLPLVLIQHKGKLYYPNQIKKGTPEKKFGLIATTQFSKDDWTDQMFFCPADSTKQIDRINKANELLQNSPKLQKYFGEPKVSENCLFIKKFGKDNALQCAEEPKPAIYPVKVSNEHGEKNVKHCGPYNRGKLYKFVYDVCPPIKFLHRIGVYALLLFFNPEMAKFIRKVPFDGEQQIVYKICYDPEKHETIYTKHIITSFNLLFDERLKNEKRKQHIMMNDTYDDFNKNTDFLNMEKFYENLKTPKTLDQSSNNEDSDVVKSPNVYLPQSLVPADDMAFYALKKTTFHYINVKPMHERLVELWNYIGELIRDNFKDSEPPSPLKIYTGTFTSKDHSSENWPVGVPHMWIKLLYTKEVNYLLSPALVILMKNEYDHREYDFTLSGLCQINYCESFKQKKHLVERFSSLALEKIRCCLSTDKIKALFGIKLIYEDKRLMTIAGLTDEGKKIENVL